MSLVVIPQRVKAKLHSKIMVIGHCTASIIAHYDASNMAAILWIACLENFKHPHIVILIYKILDLSWICRLKSLVNVFGFEHLMLSLGYTAFIANVCLRLGPPCVAHVCSVLVGVAEWPGGGRVVRWLLWSLHSCPRATTGSNALGMAVSLFVLCHSNNI